jgi:hypothetical protein
MRTIKISINLFWIFVMIAVAALAAASWEQNKSKQNNTAITVDYQTDQNGNCYAVNRNTNNFTWLPCDLTAMTQ